MRFVAPAALFVAGLLVAGSASADEAARVAPPLPVAAPQAAPVVPTYVVPAAPPYAAPPPYAPGYAPPYGMYPAPGMGAPPPYWMPMAPRPRTERRSNAMRTTGIVFFGMGGAVTVVGAVMFGATISTPCQIFDAFDSPQPGGAPAASSERVRSARQALNGCDTSPGVGLGIMGIGLVTAAAVGVPLFVLGTQQVPARTTIGKLVPVVRVGAANGSLTWTF